MIVRIKRHVYGHQNYSKWTQHTITKGLRANLKSWRDALADLADTGDLDANPFPPILDLANFGSQEETWHNRTIPEIRQVVIPAFLAAKKLLPGNFREDARCDFGGLMAGLQSEFSAGRIKPSFKTILAARQKQMYTMEAVISQDITHTKPTELNTLLTENFHTWYASPEGADACHISQPDAHWPQLGESKEALNRHAPLNIPKELVDVIWTAANKNKVPRDSLTTWRLSYAPGVSHCNSTLKEGLSCRPYGT